MTSPTPQHIGKYDIQATLGKGAMGVVYRGYDAHIDRVVAIKTIRKAAFSDDELADAMGRFQREAQAAGRLVHPNIVTVYEYGEEDDSAFIAMEFVEGRSLKELVRAKKAFSVRAIRTICTQLLAGLQYAHGHGVIHRDIKLENILLTREGRVKIMDFGIARVESSSLTSVGTFMGTPAYMAPELFADEEADARSDLFAVGVVLYQLITGSRPFAGSNMTAIMHQVLNVEPARPSTLVTGVPAEVDRLLAKALAKERQQRFASGKELASAVQEALASLDDCLVLSGTRAGGQGGDDATLYHRSSAGAGDVLLHTLQGLPIWQQGLIVLFVAALLGLGIWLLAAPDKETASSPDVASGSPREIQALLVKKKVVTPQKADSPDIKVISPGSSKRRSSPEPSSAKNYGGISITSKPYQGQSPRPVGGGIRITVPD